jgi:hypothetical protein
MKKIRLFYIFIICLVASACKHIPEVTVSNTITAPSDLIYSPASIQMQTGTNVVSVKPSINGTQPINFSIGTDPENFGGIRINSEGVITADSTLASGIYYVTVTATNGAGGVTFPNVYQITAEETVDPPANLTYTSNSLNINEGDSAISVLPSVSGTSPMDFSITSSPSDNHISITSSGEIKVSSGLPVGTYIINVTASNAAGSVTFDNALTIVVSPIAPSELLYTPNYLSLVVGAGGTSAVPTISGTLPITYSLTSSPEVTPSSKISINSSGVITVQNSLASGTYVISVTATNAAGGITFNNIFTVNVSSTATAPSGLSYSTNSLTITQGQSGTSLAPSISGTTPITFSLSSSPSSGGNITISPSTGVISASSSLIAGTYNITVTATNSVDATVFNNVYTITVGTPTLPSGLTYSPDTYTVTQGSTGSSAIPAISGSQPITYTVSVAPSTADISINSQGVISSNSNLTAGSYFVSVTATNSAGSQTFSNIYTIVVNTPPITFTNDIKPLILSKCGNCHTGGGQTNYTIYTNTKTDISLILDRIQRASNKPGFMPKNGTPLTASEINLFMQWQAQGFIE